MKAHAERRSDPAPRGRRMPQARLRAHAGAARTAASDEAALVVIQKHAATRLHYDFRSRSAGAVSWAVPRAELRPAEKRMAVHVEDHPSTTFFRGHIPPKQYGAGHVIVWDRGTGSGRRSRQAWPTASWSSGACEKLAGLWSSCASASRAIGRTRGCFSKEDEWASRVGYDVVTALPDSVITSRLDAGRREKPGGSAAARSLGDDAPVAHDALKGASRRPACQRLAATRPLSKPCRPAATGCARSSSTAIA